MYSDNLTQKVAQAAAKIMDEELKGKQHKIDANKNNKIDAHDFKLLKAKKEVKEESEQVEEELKGKQHKIDANKNGKVDAHDFKLLRAKKEVKEESEQLDELSPKTLGSYVKKAHRSGTDNSFDHGEDEHRQDGDSDDTEREKEMQDRERAIANREKGIGRAVKKLTKEEQEQIDERQLTEPEMEKKEEIVKSMKKGLSGFKARYGKDAKSVMYATATKQAKGE
jgi:hypothetical protein